MAIETRTFSGMNPKLKIDLFEMFGQRVPDSISFRQRVGQAIIDEIRDRTERGIARDGKSFPRYSKAYSKSLEFRAAGKSRGEVNLTLTGDMLGFMDIIDQTRNTITIGFSDREDQLKAHGHIMGSSPGPRVKRDFFGLPDSAYDRLKSGFTLPEDPTDEEQPGVLQGLLTLGSLFGGG